MKKNHFKYLIYASLLFLAIALYQADYFQIPKIYCYKNLGIALFFLMIAFLGDAFSWKKILADSGFKISFSSALASTGLSIFTKYIPGKVLIILGRAAYVTEKHSFSLQKTSLISLQAQFISLWLGLSLGTIGLISLGKIGEWKWTILLLWLGLTLVVFTKTFHKLAEKIFHKFFKKNIEIPQIDFKSNILLLPYFLIYWLATGLGFYFLILSFGNFELNFAASLAFPFAATLGMLAIVVPGGLGLREGILVAYLSWCGLPILEATSISIVSRLWFLLGEGFIFILGLISNRLKNQLK